MTEIPPRGPALRGVPMILSFDVDCGELVPGHRFVARGLSGPVELTHPDDEDWPDLGEYPADGDSDGVLVEGAGPWPVGPGGYTGFSLEYELAPGVTEDEERSGSSFRFIVGISYAADVELPWEPTDGGAIACGQGGATTHGSRGDWPLPSAASVLTFTLTPVKVDGFQYDTPAGDLVVDLRRSAAQWRPKAKT